MYSLPLAITGDDCPGKSAVQRASLALILSGRPFSCETPTCAGPRQSSHPRTEAAGISEARNWLATSSPAMRANFESDSFMILFVPAATLNLAGHGPETAASSPLGLLDPLHGVNY